MPLSMLKCNIAKLADKQTYFETIITKECFTKKISLVIQPRLQYNLSHKIKFCWGCHGQKL